MQAGLAAIDITGPEVSRLQEKQRAAVERSRNRTKGRDDDPYPSTAEVHPDLQDLRFGSLGTDQR